MEIREVKCENCGKTILILDGYVREKMFCTLGCLNASIASDKRMIQLNC
jgi:hypothetical protein